MDFKQFNTGTNDISRRLDKVIRVFASSLSLSEIYKGIRKGLIRVNNKKTKEDYRINEGDIIYIASFLLENNKKLNTTPSVLQDNHKSLKVKLDIVFENEHLLIINKPYNINVHGDENSLDKIVDEYYKINNNTSSLSFRPGPLHRLDRKTTGLIAFSKSLEGAHWFTENIQNHVIEKKYLGLATNILDKTSHWVDIITKDDANGSSFHKVCARTLRNYEQITNKEKIADTTACPIAYGKFNGQNVTLVEYRIKTGRKHQIRSQSSLHGHALLGDTAYGSNRIGNMYQEFYLTAYSLSFPKENPLGLPEKIEIELNDNFINILKDCGINKSVV